MTKNNTHNATTFMADLNGGAASTFNPTITIKTKNAAQLQELSDIKQTATQIATAVSFQNLATIDKNSGRMMQKQQAQAQDFITPVLMQ